MFENSFFSNAVIYLAAAVVLVPLTKRTGLGSVVGYLLAGVFIGPSVLGWIGDPEAILHFSEFGVVLLMFLIGLELNPARLWRMRVPIFALGAAQVILTTALFTLAAALVLDVIAAVVVAMALSLSSTAMALQMSEERGLAATHTGRLSFSVLLFQDLAVVPMLALIPLLGFGPVSEGTHVGNVLQIVGAVAGVVLGGRYAIRPIFRFIAKTRLREIFTAFTLLIVCGVALLIQAAGLSMALGAFLAGVLLADSEYRHELELEVEPFKGLLMGLFFVSVGMTIDLSILWEAFWSIIAAVAALMIGKFVILYGLARLSKTEDAQARMFAALLAQGGEFAFIILGVAYHAALLPAAVYQPVLVVVSLSMFLAPLLVLLSCRSVSRRLAQNPDPDDEALQQHAPVILAGFGRMGQVIGRLLAANQIPATIIDNDPDHIELTRRFGWRVHYGDATRLDLLRAADVEQARLLVVAVDDQDDALEIVDLMRQHFPSVPLLVRAHDRTHAYELLDRGIENFHRETLESALAMGRSALVTMGFEEARAQAAVNVFRKHDVETLRKMHPLHKQPDQLVSHSIQAREDLKQLMQQELGATGG